MCTMNIRTINEHNLRNNKNCKATGTKIGTLSKLKVRNKNERTRK